MRGFLIDPYKREITEVDTDAELESLYSLLDCEMVEAVGLSSVDDLWLDENGIMTLTADTMFFKVEGLYQPYAGKGLVLGADVNTGESLPVSMSLEELELITNFYSLNEIKELYNEN